MAQLKPALIFHIGVKDSHQKMETEKEGQAQLVMDVVEEVSLLFPFGSVFIHVNADSAYTLLFF